MCSLLGRNRDGNLSHYFHVWLSIPKSYSQVTCKKRERGRERERHLNLASVQHAFGSAHQWLMRLWLWKSYEATSSQPAFSSAVAVSIRKKEKNDKKLESKNLHSEESFAFSWSWVEKLLLTWMPSLGFWFFFNDITFVAGKVTHTQPRVKVLSVPT